MYNQKLIRTLEDRFDKLQAYLFRSFDGVEDLYSFIASIMYDKDYADCCEIVDGKPNPQGKELRNRVKQFLLPVVEECGGISEMADKITTDKIRQAVKDEFQYRTSQGKTNYNMEDVIYIVNWVIDEVASKENEVEAQEQSPDVDMQMRVIKGDMKYLAEKVDKLSSLLDEQKVKF